MSNRGLDWLKEAALDRELASGVFNTLVLVWLECWDGTSVRWSLPSTIPALAKAWNVHRGTLWRQIERLSQFGWIEVMRVTPAIIRIRPSADALTLRDGRASATSRRAGALGGGVLLIEDTELIKEDSPTTVAETRPGRASATEPYSLIDVPEDFQERFKLLTNARVFSSSAAIIADQDHATIDFIQSWLDYIKCDKDRGIGFAVRRMTDGDLTPEYCLTCGGVDGDHSWVHTEKDGDQICPRSSWTWNDDEIILQFGEIRWDRRD